MHITMCDRQGVTALVPEGRGGVEGLGILDALDLLLDLQAQAG